MKFYFKFLYIKPLLMLVGLLVCASSMAKDIERLTSAQQNTENSAASAGQTVMSSPGLAAISWSLLPGESLNDVARLFYPKNRQMQHLFIAKTMLFSREIQPNLDPAATSTQENLIIIPNIKLLSKQSGENKSARSKLRQTEDTERLVTSPKIDTDYDNLLKRNAFFKQELEKLNIRLANLQQMLEALKIDVMRIVNLALPAPAPASVLVTNVAAEPEAKPVEQKQDADLQKYQSQNSTVKNSLLKPTQATAPISAAGLAALSNTKQIPFVSQHLLIPILSLLFVISMFGGLGLYIRRQAKNSFIKADNFTRNLTQPMSKADALLLQSEFTGSISELDVNAKMDYAEEGELVLEQAKIYVNLYREKEAIALLQAHIQATPKTALHHWLYLLDIYRSANKKEEFLRYAEQLHQSFNVVMPRWEKASSAIAHSLEEFPYIAEKVTRLWADCEKESKKIAQIKGYLDELLMDNRNGERRGFSMEVFQEIMLLRNMLDMREKLAQG